MQYVSVEDIIKMFDNYDSEYGKYPESVYEGESMKTYFYESLESDTVHLVSIDEN